MPPKLQPRSAVARQSAATSRGPWSPRLVVTLLPEEHARIAQDASGRTGPDGKPLGMSEYTRDALGLSQTPCLWVCGPAGEWTPARDNGDDTYTDVYGVTRAYTVGQRYAYWSAPRVSEPPAELVRVIQPDAEAPDRRNTQR